MADPRLVGLIQRLVSRTATDSLNWERTPIEDVYGLSLGNYSIRLSRESTAFGEAFDYRFTIFDSDGRAVDSFTDVELFRDSPDEERKLYYQSVEDLYNKARRRAMGLDRAIDEILKEIDKKK